MEGLSIIIPVFNKIGTTLKCIDSIRDHNRNAVYEIIIVDNGSTDETQGVFLKKDQNQENPSKMTYIRNDQNLGVSKALNIGADAAGYDALCFMHNDVFVLRENWTVEIAGFISKTPDAGVVGLYGAKTLRKDGTFRGKTIVHAENSGPAMNRPVEKVAVVDGLLMAMHKKVFQKSGGYCDGFSVHYYDKDISLRAYKNGFVNYVLNIPFEHVCAATRAQIPDEDSIRDEAQEIFREVWSVYLPLDVSSWKDRISYTVKRRKDS
jgi:glycosyltransferase involved in cell wall biosynthesis